MGWYNKEQAEVKIPQNKQNVSNKQLIQEGDKKLDMGTNLIKDALVDADIAYETGVNVMTDLEKQRQQQDRI